MKLLGRNVVVFDVECRRAVDGNEVTWKSFSKMGISVASALDYRTLDYCVFMQDNIHQLAELICQADLVVGFNILAFDIPLLEATIGTILPPINTYDILRESRIACGWKPDDEYSAYPKGLKLDDHLLGTFGKDFMKTADGAEAPKMWQENRLGELISYNLADVRRESRLFEHVVENGWVSTPKYHRKTLRSPF